MGGGGGGGGEISIIVGRSSLQLVDFTVIFNYSLCKFLHVSFFCYGFLSSFSSFPLRTIDRLHNIIVFSK